MFTLISYGSFANTCINSNHLYHENKGMCIVCCHSIMRPHTFYNKMKLIVDRNLTHVQITFDDNFGDAKSYQQSVCSEYFLADIL